MHLLRHFILPDKWEVDGTYCGIFCSSHKSVDHCVNLLAVFMCRLPRLLTAPTGGQFGKFVSQVSVSVWPDDEEGHTRNRKVGSIRFLCSTL